MTPRSFALTPSVTAEDVSESQSSDAGSGDESLPPHTSEIGTLKKLPNHGTAWLGSSSGVYFVNTVRRAFSAALLNSNASALPPSEDILTGEDAEGRHYNGPVADPGQSAAERDFRQVILASLGRPPADRSLAMELVTTFFRRWHPLFPFMHGPRFLQDVDAIYAMPETIESGKFTPTESRRITTFQLIINIASLDRRDLHLPLESRIKSTSDVTRVAGCFAVNHDIASIQLLIAAELYLVATISIRQASTVAGMILKLIYHAGLHRCPLRYAQLSLEDCEIRRRVFWSFYALDRHLSLSLGDPNTVQDNDIDVCLSGRELHKAVAKELVVNPADEIKMHLPQSRPKSIDARSPSNDPQLMGLNDSPQAREKAQRESAMAAYVHYGKLTGRIIEIFHKSIHARLGTPERIMFLNSDIETWWNELPASLTSDAPDDMRISQTEAHNATTNTTTNSAQDTSNSTSNQAPTHSQLAPFFLILYHQLQLLLNRPRLSLDQSTAEFQHGLQICIKASRNTLIALKKHRDNDQSMLLPGLLSATWMAGLIIAFACQLGKYPKIRAVSDIGSCLGILESMGYSHWFTVKNCHKVLNLLLQNIRGRRAGRGGFLTNNTARTSASAGSGAQQTPASRKRTHDDTAAGDARSPKRKSTGDAAISPVPVSAVSGSTSTARSRSTRKPGPHQRQNSLKTSNTAGTEVFSTPPTPLFNEWSPPPSSQSQPQPPDLPSSTLYANPRDLSTQTQPQSQSTHPSATDITSGTDQAILDFNDSDMTMNMNVDDPLFWGNFDFNIGDIFGAASWENLMPMDMAMPLSMSGDGSGSGNGGTGLGWDLFGGGAGNGSGNGNGGGEAL